MGWSRLYSRVSPADAARVVASLGTLGIATLLLVEWLHVAHPAIVSTTFLLVVLVTAATARLWIAVVTSFVAMLCFNYFFLPPVGTWTIADPLNWAALIAFLAVSLVASNLSAVARTRTEEAVGRRDELARLFDLSRDVLMMTASADAISGLVRSVARRFDLEIVAIALPRAGAWEVFEAGARTTFDHKELSRAFESAQASIEFDAQARAYAGHSVTSSAGRSIRLIPLRVGTRPIGLLAASGRPLEAGTLDALAGLVAIAIERARLLEERKAAELTRHSEQLKTALLASIAHDLRTPLAAIRIAATNVQSADLSPGERTEQSDIILAEVERLTRLFENILEMARIDAGSIVSEKRWVHPSELIAAARDQVEQTLKGHQLEMMLERDVPVCVDARLLATSLARLLENAAQYAPIGSTIHLEARVGDEGLVMQVRDHGPGISPADLPHLFERFYRGEGVKSRVSGTGMGLAIAQGLLSVAGGRMWAENALEGGALFTIQVPAASQAPAPDAS